MSFWAAAAAIAVAIPLASAAANTALHWRRFRPPPATAQGRGRAAAPTLSARALIDEALATAAVFLAPLAALAPRRRRGAAGRPPLVVLCDPISAAAGWLLLRRLRAAGWQPVRRRATAPPLAPAALDGLVDSLLEATDSAASRGAPLTVLGLGAGGLLARQLAAREPRFARVVTLSTPHQGTQSRAAPRRLRPGSPYVEAVARCDTLPRQFDAVAIYSDGDAWIEPRQAGYCPAAFNLEVHDLGHLSTFFSRRVFDYVDENLSAPAPMATTRRRDDDPAVGDVAPPREAT